MVVRTSIPVDFLPIIQEFTSYVDALPRYAPSSTTTELALEARKRLRQIYTLSTAVHTYGNAQEKLRNRAEAVSGVSDSQSESLMIQSMQSLEVLEMYAECFYLIAWRLCQVLRELPGFHGFDCKGIRTVRNRLVQHPNPKDQPLLPSFAFDDERGPILKPWAAHGRRPLDHGLWPNAKELASMIEVSLRSFVEASGRADQLGPGA